MKTIKQLIKASKCKSTTLKAIKAAALDLGIELKCRSFADAASKLEAVKAVYLPKSGLDTKQLFVHLGMKKDNGGRIEPSSATPEFVKQYLSNYRYPSRAFPLSYFRALLTEKFAKYLCNESPEMAVRLGVAKYEPTC